ncbi:MAG: serine/threonine protein kinase [Planctomycetes bacterium]|nr:serine/threonine protein kinase [Planctomycetota bacterium]
MTAEAQSKNIVSLALKAGYITQQQVSECLRARQVYNAQGKEPPAIEEILLEKGYIARQQIDQLSAGLQREARLFGEIVIKSGISDVEKVKECLLIQHQIKANKQVPPRIGEIMVSKGYLTVADVRKVLEEQNKRIVNCPMCKASFNVREYQPGDSINCRNCNASITVLENDQIQMSDNIAVGMTLIGDAPETRSQMPGSALGPGDVVGEFAIIDQLGLDIEGAIFKAQHTTKGAIVSLKVMKTSRFKDEASVNEFIDTLKRAARLRHANLRRILSAGQSGDNVFVAMEFLEGDSLRNLIKHEGQIYLQKAKFFIQKIAEVLKVVHAAGFVHGDIRPSNVFLDVSGQVKLMGLGMRPNIAENVKSLTGAGGLAPFHFAPEQVAEGGKVDQRTDIYGLGATFFNMLAGRAPFEGSSPFEILVRLQKDFLPSLKSYNAGIPDALCVVIEKMLKPRPKDRYKTVDDFLGDLVDPDSAFDRLIGESSDLLVGGHDEKDEDWIPLDFDLSKESISERAARRGETKTGGKLTGVIVLVVVLVLAAVGVIAGANFFGGGDADETAVKEWTGIVQTVNPGTGLDLNSQMVLIQNYVNKHQGQSGAGVARCLREANDLLARLGGRLENAAATLISNNIEKINGFCDPGPFIAPNSQRDPATFDARFGHAISILRDLIQREQDKYQSTDAWNRFLASKWEDNIVGRARTYLDWLNTIADEEIKKIGDDITNASVAARTESHINQRIEKFDSLYEIFKNNCGSEPPALAQLSAQATERQEALRASRTDLISKLRQRDVRYLKEQVTSSLSAAASAYEANLDALEAQFGIKSTLEYASYNASVDTIFAAYFRREYKVALDKITAATANFQLDRDRYLSADSNPTRHPIWSRLEAADQTEINMFAEGEKAEPQKHAEALLASIGNLKCRIEAEQACFALVKERAANLRSQQNGTVLRVTLENGKAYGFVDSNDEAVQLNSEVDNPGAAPRTVYAEWYFEGVNSPAGAKLTAEALVTILKTALREEEGSGRADAEKQKMVHLGLGLIMHRYAKILSPSEASDEGGAFGEQAINHLNIGREAESRLMRQPCSRFINVDQLISEVAGASNALSEDALNLLKQEYGRLNNELTTIEEWIRFLDRLKRERAQYAGDGAWASASSELDGWVKIIWQRQSRTSLEEMKFISFEDGLQGFQNISSRGSVIMRSGRMVIASGGVAGYPSEPSGKEYSRVRFRIYVPQPKSQEHADQLSFRVMFGGDEIQPIKCDGVWLRLLPQDASQVEQKRQKFAAQVFHRTGSTGYMPEDIGFELHVGEMNTIDLALKEDGFLLKVNGVAMPENARAFTRTPRAAAHPKVQIQSVPGPGPEIEIDWMQIS